MDIETRLKNHGWVYRGLDAGGAEIEYAREVFTHIRKGGYIIVDSDGSFIHHFNRDFAKDIGQCDIPVEI